MAGLTQGQLAAAANISVPTLKRMEAAKLAGVAGQTNNVMAVVAVLEGAGVDLIAADDAAGPGVRLRHSKT